MAVNIFTKASMKQTYKKTIKKALSKRESIYERIIATIRYENLIKLYLADRLKRLTQNNKVANKIIRDKRCFADLKEKSKDCHDTRIKF